MVDARIDQVRPNGFCVDVLDHADDLVPALRLGLAGFRRRRRRNGFGGRVTRHRRARESAKARLTTITSAAPSLRSPALNRRPASTSRSKVRKKLRSTSTAPPRGSRRVWAAQRSRSTTRHALPIVGRSSVNAWSATPGSASSRADSSGCSLAKRVGAPSGARASSPRTVPDRRSPQRTGSARRGKLAR